MPCDSITTQTVSEALKNGMPNLVAQAMTAAGWVITAQDEDTIAAKRGAEKITWAKGRGLTVTASTATFPQSIVQGIVQNYSKAAVSWAASRAGWTTKSTGLNTMTLSKR